MGAKSLAERVYRCAACSSDYGFEVASAPGHQPGYFKFPPTIGAPGHADLLFMGINPRRSSTNIQLARTAMATPENFRVLSANREPLKGGRTGASYVRAAASDAKPSPYRWEDHYAIHAQIVQSVWGPSARFEDHAAVTELYFCSTENTRSGRLPLRWDSPCMKRYFDEVMAQAQPRVIVAVGAPPRDFLRSKSADDSTNPFRIHAGGLEPWVFVIGHPADTYSNRNEAAAMLNRAKMGVRRTLRDGDEPTLYPSVWPPLRSSSRPGPHHNRRVPAVPGPARTARNAPGASAAPIEDWWPRVLAPREIPPRGRLLASHPEAEVLTRRLLANLTVARLVRIANVQHNYCGPKDLRKLSPVDRTRDAELAWRELLKHSNMPQGGSNGWTGVIKLLTPGAERGLAKVQTMQVGELIALCARLVEGPYAEANARGVR